jgi:hypothetical protein
MEQRPLPKNIPQAQQPPAPVPQWAQPVDAELELQRLNDNINHAKGIQ